MKPTTTAPFGVRASRLGEGGVDAVVGGRAGDAVDEAHAVQEHRAGEGAEQDVLEARLALEVIRLRIADEDVEREAQEFERDIGGDQFAGGGHEDHAATSEEHQAVVLGSGFDRTLAHVVRRHERHDEDDAAARRRKKVVKSSTWMSALEALRFVAEIEEAATNQPTAQGLSGRRGASLRSSARRVRRR
jgi:hypothetical protein